MNKLSLATALVMSLVLTGCFDDKPSDKIASEAVRKIADSDAAEGLDVANFERSNGQVDPNSANLYKVTYTYNLKLTKPYAEAILANAKLLQAAKVESAKRETGAFFDAAKLQNNLHDMQSTMAINQWIASQEDKFRPRRNALLNNCAPCVAWWNSEDAPNEGEARRRAFISSWMYYESLGFKDDAKEGDNVPRSAWAYFSKTEKGWQSAN